MMVPSVGAPYPGPVAEGATFDAFGPVGSVLRVGIPNMTSSGARAYLEGAVRFGLALDAGAILTLWRFGAGSWIDAPFDAPPAQARGRLELIDLHSQSPLAIELHLVDAASGIVRGLRTFTLTAQQSTAFTSAVHDQLADGSSDVGFVRLLARSPAELAATGEIR